MIYFGGFPKCSKTRLHPYHWPQFSLLGIGTGFGNNTLCLFQCYVGGLYTGLNVGKNLNPDGHCWAYGQLIWSVNGKLNPLYGIGGHWRHHVQLLCDYSMIDNVVIYN